MTQSNVFGRSFNGLEKRDCSLVTGLPDRSRLEKLVLEDALSHVAGPIITAKAGWAGKFLVEMAFSRTKKGEYLFSSLYPGVSYEKHGYICLLDGLSGGIV